VDQGMIGIRPAVEISYLPTKYQKDLMDWMEIEQSTPSHTGDKDEGKVRNWKTYREGYRGHHERGKTKSGREVTSPC
jgi:hypothetical protein